MCKAGPVTSQRVEAATHVDSTVPCTLSVTAPPGTHVIELRNTSTLAADVEIESALAQDDPLSYPLSSDPKVWRRTVTLSAVEPRDGTAKAKRALERFPEPLHATGPGGGRPFQVRPGLRVKSTSSRLWIPHKLGAALNVIVT